MKEPIYLKGKTLEAKIAKGNILRIRYLNEELLGEEDQTYFGIMPNLEPTKLPDCKKTEDSVKYSNGGLEKTIVMKNNSIEINHEFTNTRGQKQHYQTVWSIGIKAYEKGSILIKWEGETEEVNHYVDIRKLTEKHYEKISQITITDFKTLKKITLELKNYQQLTISKRKGIITIATKTESIQQPNTKPTNHQIIIKPHESPLGNIEEHLVMEKGITLAEFNKKRQQMEEAFRKATREEVIEELRKEKKLKTNN